MKQSAKENAKNLFRFLKAFSRLRLKPLLNIESYEKVIWLHELPSEKECFSITRHIAALSENSEFKKWAEVKKPCPLPPSEIKPWLKSAPPIGQCKKEPELLSYILQSSGQAPAQTADSPEEENKKVFLRERPEIKNSFEGYLREKWRPWAEEENRAAPVLKAYNELYGIYRKHKFQGEIYQIALGLGFLSSETEKGHVRRHIVTAPAAIGFHPVSGAIAVKPPERGAELSLEMDMIADAKKPANSGDIGSRLSDLNDDFWIKGEFYDCLKSWLNSYSSDGQFFQNFGRPPAASAGSFTSLTVSPAIILRKRNERAFEKFYNEALADMDSKDDDSLKDRPCLSQLFHKKPASSSQEALPGSSAETEAPRPLDGKHYFPFPANEEQEKIIDKVSSHDQVLVQGPPGTGKTHSIANLISHFLAEGKKILVTSQADRALRVLKNKLPEGIQPLCVEIMGGDQKSLQRLEKSFEAINSRYQKGNQRGDPDIEKKINKMEKEDNRLKGRIATVKNELIKLRNSETIKYENKFGRYTGTPAAIASRLKKEEKEYQWIKEAGFDAKISDECPASNSEMAGFMQILKNLKGAEESVLSEPADFSYKLPDIEQFKEIIEDEKTAKKTLNSFADSGLDRAGAYESLRGADLKSLLEQMRPLCANIESLSNRSEQWIRRALAGCLADADGAWRYLRDETNKQLASHGEMFSEADKVRTITGPEEILKSDFKIEKILDDFFKRHKSGEKISWGLFSSKPAKALKQIKINGRKISSYGQAKKLQSYVKATGILRRLINLWKSQAVDTKIKDKHFVKNSLVFKDFCEILEKCLAAHDLLEKIKGILLRHHIPQPDWNPESVKTEKNAMALARERQKIKETEKYFKNLASFLEPHREQKNRLAAKIISACSGRSLEEYRRAWDQIKDFLAKQKDFKGLRQIRGRLKNQAFCQKLKQSAGDPLWESRLRGFEEAWAWLRADQWIAEMASGERARRLNQEMRDLTENQRRNMERLVSEKAWHSCLSQIKEEELRNLKALIKSIEKIGKGTGKSAPRHRREAQKRMEQAKTAIPAWIMPLYRAVENIKPGAELFDIAIIDEASQTGPEGFLLNYLAKKLIIVGDSRQISPENPGIKDDDVEALKKKYLSDIEFSEHIGRENSFYDFYEILLTKSHIQLREHFRCMPEIIEFSNQIAYRNRALIPLRQYGSGRLPPLKAFFVKEAVSRKGSGREPQNEKEAQAIADQIKKCIGDSAYEGKTFGVICLQGKAQTQIIEKALIETDKKEMEERKIHVGTPYSFQGDERDVIFLSMAVAKDWRLTSLARDTYLKMYNVAVSRARDQLWLFHSVEESDLSPRKDDLRRQLLRHFKGSKGAGTGGWPPDKLKELYRKIKETQNKSPENAPDPFDSWFEARVFYEIALRGCQVIPQYEVSGCRIDMVIVGSGARLAVECDGDYFHSGEEKEGADLERQWNLERCGWRFWRLRESEFNRDKEKALESLWKLLDEMDIRPL